MGALRVPPPAAPRPLRDSQLANGVRRLGLADYQFTVETVHLLADRDGHVLHIQVRPQQGEELASPQAGGQLQIEAASSPRRSASARYGPILSSGSIFISRFSSFGRRQLSGVGEDQPLRHRLLQTVVQQRVDAPYHTGAKTLVASSPVLKCRENISLGSGVKFFSLLFCKFNTYLRFLLTWLCE